MQLEIDARGRRVRKSSPLGERQFHYDPANRLIAESDASGAYDREYLYLNDLPVAVVAGGTLYHIDPDHLGTPRLVTDGQGAAVWRWEGGEPFGAQAPEEDPNQTGSRFVLNLRFPGQYYDAETQLHYNHHRDYDPATGRYVESDPIGLDGGINTYTYVNGNPIGMMDPSGLLAIAGNWCGPNWTGGKEETFSPTASYGYYDPATGRTDRACQRHDACYQECRQRNCSSDNEKAACFRKCDRQLASEIPFSSRDSVPIGQQSLIWFWMRFNRFQSAND